MTSGLDATSQWEILLPHFKNLRLAFALICTLTIPLDVLFSYYLGTQGEI